MPLHFSSHLICNYITPPPPRSCVHSPLCRKYPIKEPFVELMKGSLNTFLNAFTYPDRTCYPVASTNAQVRQQHQQQVQQQWQVSYCQDQVQRQPEQLWQ